MKPRLAANELRIICTDHGEHTPRELAVLNTGKPANGLTLDALGSLLDDAKSDPPADVEGSGALAAMDRVQADSPLPPVPARPAFPRPRSRLPKGEIVRHIRADGGLTFEFPPCPTCQGQPRLIRAAKLAAFMRAAPGQPLDVSLIP